jgi:hypothetical protein
MLGLEMPMYTYDVFSVCTALALESEKNSKLGHWPSGIWMLEISLSLKHKNIALLASVHTWPFLHVSSYQLQYNTFSCWE